MPARGLLIALLFLTVSPQNEPRMPIHVESLSYPPLARMARISGNIVATVWIDPEGRVSIPVLPNGHPLLVHAVEENIKTWRFRSGPGSELKVSYHFRIKSESKLNPLPTICKFDLPDSVAVVTPMPPVETIE